MSKSVANPNPAERASQDTLAEVYDCIRRKESFVVEAGAGAGKTYTLIKALQFLIETYALTLPRGNQKIACITFTNVAKDEIDARTDRSPIVYCNTIHAFCWSLISGFQKQLRELLPQLDHWPRLIQSIGELGQRPITYDLGHRSIEDHRVSIHHNDVLLLTSGLMRNSKFRSIFTLKFPVVLIDEFQDTDAGWIESIKHHFLGQEHSPQFGFFGDPWQKIYGNGCGQIAHASLRSIGKKANFRSVPTIVDCLNRMRPALPQDVVDPTKCGEVRVFHTNTWRGTRQTSSHWRGDLPTEIAEYALNSVITRLTEESWDLSPSFTKILMLTHRVLASQQGYPSIPTVFRYNESFTRKDHPHIAYFCDILEPACEAYISRRYGEMFSALGSRVPAILSHGDKVEWSSAMAKLVALRNQGTVGEVMDHLLGEHKPRVPDTIAQTERELRAFDESRGEEMSRSLKELRDLRAVSYEEIIRLCSYLSGHSPFETKHGVKGAEFENVIVVVGRGWNRYNFSEMLELESSDVPIQADKRDEFERNRNLFYVTCSRPKNRLAVLFTQHLSYAAMGTVNAWFGAENVATLDL